MAATASPVRAFLVLAGAALASQIALGVLGSRGIAGDVLAAVAVDLIAARFGAPWYGEGVLPTRGLLRDAGVGALIGTAAVAVSVGLAVALRLASIHALSFTPVSLVLGSVASIAIAIRTEVIHRWIPLRLGRAWAPPLALQAYAVLLGAAPVVATAPLRPGAVLVALSIGALSVVCIERSKGLATSVGVHAAALAMTSLVVTGALDVRWSAGSISPLESASGPGAYVIAAALALTAAAVAKLRAPPGTPDTSCRSSPP